LLDQEQVVLRKKHCRIRTEQTYVDWIKRFICHFDKRPLSEPSIWGRMPLYIAERTFCG
jgi:hypothetical protein